MSAVLRAVDALNDQLAHADAIGQAFDLAAGEQAPAWVSVFRGQIEAISAAAEALEVLLRQSGEAMP